MESGSGTESGGGSSYDTASGDDEARKNSFADVVALVNRRSKILVLSDQECGASIAVWPAMQGRVLCSSVAGMDGLASGWVNAELISSGDRLEHVNSVGGEDRIWLGPEGGQFSLFFAPGVPFDLDHWFTPAPLDIEPFELIAATDTSLSFARSFDLSNYSGTKFRVRLNREVRLLPQETIWEGLNWTPGGSIRAVGFESENMLTNIADTAWRRESGLVSLWVLGQFQADPQTSLILPIQAGSEAELGVSVTSDYFGPVPEDRISIRADSVLFRADGNFRSKLGLSPRRARGILGSYDARNHVLTIVQYTQSAETDEYVNSSWKIQDEPYRGDVANCYNDGPSDSGGRQLGKFYELESSSPARELKPGESIVHTQRTIHLSCSEEELDELCRANLGVCLDEAQSITG